MTRTSEELQRRDLDQRGVRDDVSRFSPTDGEDVDYTVTHKSCPKCGLTISRFHFVGGDMVDVHYCPLERAK